MINFKSRNISIRQAERITLLANSVYPHFSESKSILSIHKALQKNTDNQKKCYRLLNLKLKLMSKMDELRFKNGLGLEQFRIIINDFKNHKLGNCFESAVLAQIIGKINGQKNIYPAQIFFTKDSSKVNVKFDHAVAIITDKPFEKDYLYQFKNKDAIIIDPWLGITNFIEDYVTKLRTQFSKMFPKQFERYSTDMNYIDLSSKNLAEYNQMRKNCFKPKFYFKLHDEDVLSIERAKELRKEFPELILK